MDINKSSPTKLGPGKLLYFLFIYLIYLFSNRGAIPPVPLGDNDEPYPSLSDYHDYEPNLEFDDSELHQAPNSIAQTGTPDQCDGLIFSVIKIF